MSQSNLLSKGEQWPFWRSLLATISPQVQAVWHAAKAAGKGKRSLHVWPLSLESPPPRFSRHTRASWLSPGCLGTTHTLWISFIPWLLRHPSFSFLVFVLPSVYFSVSTFFFFLVLNTWHKSQITNSEMFIILIFKTTDLTFCFKPILCPMMGTEMSVNLGSSQILPHCLALPFPWDPSSFWGHGTGMWSPLIIFHAHWHDPFLSFLSGPYPQQCMSPHVLLRPPELLSEPALSLYVFWVTLGTWKTSSHCQN